jgi:hypothetical protein
MFVLAAADTIQGIADAASKVTFSIFGMTLVSGVEAYSCLAQAQFSNSEATIYTAPNPGQAFIKSIHVVNPDTASHTFQLFRNDAGGAGAAKAITPTFTLPAGTMAHYIAEVGWQFYTATGALIQNPYSIPTAYANNVLGTTGCKGATFARELCPEVNTTLITTGQIYMQAIWLPAGTVVANIKIWSATTAASGPTHYNAGIYDSSGNRLATGTDKTSTAWNANTLTTFTMQTPYTVPTTGVYYIAFGMTVSTTVPTIKGTTARTNGNLSLAAPIISGVSATAYSTGDMPVSATIPSAAVTTSMYAEVA